MSSGECREDPAIEERDGGAERAGGGVDRGEMLRMKRETVMLLLLLVAGEVVGAEADPRAALAAEAGVRHPEGAEIYRVRCASCHGEHGEGVADKYDEALYGERTVESLTRLIDRTMPEDAPEECVGEDAARVAAWVYEAFYSPAARERIDPPKLAFQHLTNEQLRKSMAALTLGVESGGGDEGRTGLRAVYWNDRDRKDDKKVLERVDAQVGFDWGEGSPLPDKIGTEAFAIGWSGSLRVPESGEYGFRVVTTNGVRLWVNAAGGGGRRGGEDAALIDGWVSSGNAARELTARMVLPGGSVVPVRLDFFKFKEKTARVRLEWQRPHGVWEEVPEWALMPERRPRVVAVQAALPPDDGSAGYGRGLEVSREWHAAVTEAALEASAVVASELEGGAGGKVEGMMKGVEGVAAKAWRRGVLEEERRWLRGLVEGGPDVETGGRRAVLGILESPSFLYPEVMPEGAGSGRRAAGRLALAMWDGLPDEALRRKAGEGKLEDAGELEREARRMLRSPLTRAKLRTFFGEWLSMDEAGEVMKDGKEYPAFTPEMVAALRRSLEMFVERVVWEGSGDWRELLEADYLYVNGPMAEMYGASRRPEGSGEFEAVTFPASERAGVLTHPYLLSVLAYHRSSSPIHRGVFLTRSILGRFLKPPPMAIAFMDGKFHADLTMREKVTELTKDENCMGCHGTINPLGFSLEGYDATGRLRYLDNGKRVMSESEYLAAGGETVMLRGPRDLARHAVASREAQKGFVRQLFQYMVKQVPGAYGSDTLTRLHEGFAASGFSVRELVVAIAMVPARDALERAEKSEVVKP